MNTVKELLSSRRMIWKLAKNDFKTKYAGSYFGILWAFVQPIVTILIYIIIFQYGFKAAPSREGYPYALTLTSGIIPWFFFSEALINATNCFMEYSYLVKKVVFKISILPVVKVVSSLFVHLFFVALVFFDFCAVREDPACAVYTDRLLYFLRVLFRPGAVLSDFSHCSLLQGFRTDREYRAAGVDVGLPHYVGLKPDAGRLPSADEADQTESFRLCGGRIPGLLY